MVEYKDAEGNVFELPKMTVGLSESLAKACDGATIRAQAKGMYDFVVSVLPKEYVEEKVGGTKLEDIDLVELRSLYDGIDSAYNDAMNAARMERVAAQMQEAAPILDAMDKVTNVQARQGFNRVK